MSAGLFTPYTIKSLVLKNRFVMAPMSRYFASGGVPSADTAAYYARRAAHEVGLIITEGAAVARPAAVESPNSPHLHGETALAAWRQVAAAVHRHGGRIAPQLWHVGAWYEQSGWKPPAPFEGPSGLKEAGNRTGIAMSEEDIADTIAAFAECAARCREAGFDAIALHGAHGYLIDQFYWADTNVRTDRWGGPTLRHRGLFATELVKAIRRAIGESTPILLRISQWKVQDYDHKMAKTPAELAAWVEPLAEAGVDLFDCSQRRYWEAEFAGSDLNFAGWVKKLTGKATMTVGSVGLSRDLMASFEQAGPTTVASLGELYRRFDRGDFDLVAVGRALLSDPQWVCKLRDGRTHEFIEFEPGHLASLE
jgi:2,4-dienoyl-CoA reductase-like NADH-dependent reductase (Old Yellow Enzyme family)